MPGWASTVPGGWSPGTTWAGAPAPTTRFTDAPGDTVSLPFNGREVEVTYAQGPDYGIFAVLIDGAPALDEDDGPLTVDGYNAALRYEERVIVDAGADGEHLLTLRVTGERDADSAGSVMGIGRLEVLPPVREANLGAILGMLLVVEAGRGAVRPGPGPAALRPARRLLDTKRTLLLALCLYVVIAVWGFMLDAVMEFWFLAFMVAIVQGGEPGPEPQPLRRHVPGAAVGRVLRVLLDHGEVLVVLRAAALRRRRAVFGSSRPAVLSVILFFVVGGWLLTRVDVEEGRRAAREAEQALAGEVEG